MTQAESDNQRRQGATKRGRGNTMGAPKKLASRRPSEASARRKAWEKAEQLARELQAAAADVPGMAPQPGAMPDRPGTGEPPALGDALATLEAGNTRSTGVEQVLNGGNVVPVESKDYVGELLKRAREHSQAALEVQVKLMNDERVPPMVRWRASQSIIELAERTPGRGGKRLGEMTVAELRALAESLRTREKEAGSGVTVEGSAKVLPEEGQQLDATSSSRGETSDQEPGSSQAAAPEPVRPRRAIE